MYNIHGGLSLGYHMLGSIRLGLLKCRMTITLTNYLEERRSSSEFCR